MSKSQELLAAKENLIDAIVRMNKALGVLDQPRVTIAKQFYGVQSVVDPTHVPKTPGHFISPAMQKAANARGGKVVSKIGPSGKRINVRVKF